MRIRRALAGGATAAALSAALAPPAAASGGVEPLLTCLEDDCLAFCMVLVADQPPSCYYPRQEVERGIAEARQAVDAYLERVEDAVGDVPPPPESNLGGGSAVGDVSFASPGIPPAGSPCAATSFTLSGSSQAFALNTVITGYAGPVTLSGSGGSACETTSSASGTLTLNASGTGPTGSTVSCVSLTGGYTRVGTDVTAVLGGTCVVNNFPARTSFVFRGQFVPTAAGAGVVGPVRHATFQGPFVVAPA